MYTCKYVSKYISPNNAVRALTAVLHVQTECVKKNREQARKNNEKTCAEKAY